MVDPLGEQGNLDVCRPGVALVNTKICDRFRFFFHTSVYHPFLLSLFNEAASLGLLPEGVKHFYNGLPARPDRRIAGSRGGVICKYPSTLRADREIESGIRLR